MRLPTHIANSLRAVSSTKLGIYILVYIPIGFVMNSIGHWLEIAKFSYWWQVFTVYGLYMIPISILLEKKPIFRQYAYGTVAMGVLEFCGYALGTSHIYPNNILDQLFGPHVFALGMTLFFGTYFPLGISVVNRLNNLFYR